MINFEKFIESIVLLYDFDDIHCLMIFHQRDEKYISLSPTGQAVALEYEAKNTFGIIDCVGLYCYDIYSEDWAEKIGSDKWVDENGKIMTLTEMVLDGIKKSSNMPWEWYSTWLYPLIYEKVKKTITDPPGSNIYEKEYDNNIKKLSDIFESLSEDEQEYIEYLEMLFTKGNQQYLVEWANSVQPGIFSEIKPPHKKAIREFYGGMLENDTFGRRYDFVLKNFPIWIQYRTNEVITVIDWQYLYYEFIARNS